MTDETLTGLRWTAAVLLIMLSALFAGLTLGMLSLDKIELEVVQAGEDKKLAACATKIIPVRRNGNLLLCTFLIGNTACNSLSSILMADLEGGVVGFVVSTVAILFFAEIIPQAVCSRYALQIGARVIWIVKFFLVLFYPIAKPVSLILDWTLGEEIGTIHTRQELSKLLQIHVTEGAIDKESGKILQGALKALSTMKVTEIMTPIDECYMLHISCTLNAKLMSEIFETGFSRIPVYDKSKDDVVALLFAKDLILVDPDDETPLRYFVSIFGRPVINFCETTIVRTAFVQLRRGHSHLALVRKPKVEVVQPNGVADDDTKSGIVPACPTDGQVLGVLTLEDIVEEIIQADIFDETDRDTNFGAPSGGGGKFRRQHTKYRLLNAQVRDTSLAREEVRALASHLIVNVDLIRDAQPPVTLECLEWVLSQSPVCVEEDPSREIFSQGTKADFCLIVLTGRIEIKLENNQFRNDVGSLSVIAPEALFDENFVPDFTAVIGSESARIVKVYRKIFDTGRRVYSLVDTSHLIGNEVGADPTIRHAFAETLLTRKRLKSNWSPDMFESAPPGGAKEGITASEPGDKNDSPHGTASLPPNEPERRSELQFAYSTGRLKRPF